MDDLIDSTLEEVKEESIAIERKSRAKPRKKERIGIFFNKWKQITSYGPQACNNFIKHYGAGEIIFDEKKLDYLLSQDAPIQVYTRDVN